MHCVPCPLGSSTNATGSENAAVCECHSGYARETSGQGKCELILADKFKATPWAAACTDLLEISRFLPSFLGNMTVFDKTEPLVMVPCEALSLLPSRLSCPTRKSCLYRMQMEHTMRLSSQRDGAARRDTLSLLLSRQRCPRRRNCVNRMPMERMVRWSCPTRLSCPTRRNCLTRQSCPTRMGSVVNPPYNQSGGM